MVTRTRRRTAEPVKKVAQILMLSPVVPDEMGSGLEKRCAIFLDALERVGKVDLCVLPLSKPNPAACRRIQNRPRVTLLPDLGPHQPDTQFALISRLRNPDDWLAAFSNYGRPSLPAMLSIAAVEALAQQLDSRRYDVVHVSRSYVAPFALELVHRLSGPTQYLSLDLDEDDASAFAMQAKLFQSGSFEAKKTSLEAIAFERLIMTVGPRFDRIWASSELECHGLNHRYLIAAQPVLNAVSVGRSVAHTPGSKRLLFVGSMEHPFNVDTARVLIDQVWPRLRGQGLHLDIVGKSPPADLCRRARQPTINVHGWVPDLRPFYKSAAALIAPIQFGAGTRFKLAEAAAHNVPIIATPIAAEGLGFHDRRDLWLARDPEGIALAALNMLNRPLEAARRAQNARTAVMRNLDRSRIVADLALKMRTMLDSDIQT